MFTLSFSIYPKDDAGEVNHESRSFQNSIAHQRYATRGTTIWQMIENYSSISQPSPPREFNSYAKRKENSSELVFFYKAPKDLYQEIVSIYEKSFSGDSVFIMANDSLTKYMKFEWRGGLDSLYAQTRIASSYGYFQVLYTTGILPIKNYGANYSRSELPEKLNETEINFEVAMLKYQALINEEANSNWANVYEQLWFDLLSNWNIKKDYNSGIFKNIKQFLPSQL